jgi:hypothetical protein
MIAPGVRARRVACREGKMVSCLLKQGFEIAVSDMISNHQGLCDRITEEIGQSRLSQEASRI